MLRRGGFAGIPAQAPIAALCYVVLKGGEPPGAECVIDFKGQSADAAADQALAKLMTLIARFDDESTPYRSLDISMWKNRYGTYDDLARVKEWSLSGGVDEIEGGGGPGGAGP